MSRDYLRESMARAQRDYDNQLPPEYDRGQDHDDSEIAPPGGSEPEQKEFDKSDWKSDIERDDTHE